LFVIFAVDVGVSEERSMLERVLASGLEGVSRVIVASWSASRSCSWWRRWLGECDGSRVCLWRLSEDGMEIHVDAILDDEDEEDDDDDDVGCGGGGSDGASGGG
jgi:hypothetical protein